MGDDGMKGDKLVIEEGHIKAASQIAEVLLPQIKERRSRFVITIAGESGSGKSEIASALSDILSKKGIKSAILQQDDYFVYPPKTNAEIRRKDINHVGLTEVRLGLLDQLGLIFSAAPTSMPSTIMMLSAMVKFPIVFISGVFIPLDQLPSWGRGISYISPLTYFTDIARHCIQNQGYLPLAIDFLALVAFTVLFVLVAMKLHQKTMPKRI